MGCWEFDMTDGSPRMARTTNLVTKQAGTQIGFFKVTSAEDFYAIFSTKVGANASECWGGADGVFHSSNNFALDETITTGIVAVGWFKLAWVFYDAGGGDSGTQVYWQPFGGAFNTGPQDARATGSTSSMRVFANDDFLVDMEGTIRCAGLRIFQRDLTSGLSSTTAIQAEFASRTAVSTTNLVFDNPGNGIQALNIDNSAAASNFTLTGSPTAIANDDPWGAADVATLVYRQRSANIIVL